MARIAGAGRNLTLEVSAPRSSPGFETDRMAYVQRAYELDYFASNRWADAPSRMLGPVLARALEESGGFGAVVQAPSTVSADVRMVTELVRLQQNFETRPSRIEITLRVQLIDVRTGRLLGTRVFEATENAPSDDPYGGVTAANVALQRILEQVVQFHGCRSRGPLNARASPEFSDARRAVGLIWIKLCYFAVDRRLTDTRSASNLKQNHKI